MKENDPRDVPIVEAAKRLRTELHQKFPNQPFSVRIDRYSMGEAINVFWADGVSSIKVDEVLRQFQGVDIDQYNGEILGGGNRYVHGHRRVSEEIRKSEEDLWAKQHQEPYGYNGYLTVWHKISSTDYPVRAQ
jgi:hypothetical protein